MFNYLTWELHREFSMHRRQYKRCLAKLASIRENH